MTQIGSVYGEALYALAKDEGLANQILEELTALKEAFRAEPDFLRLLSSPNLSKQERCQIIDDSFQGKIHVYILNFLLYFIVLYPILIFLFIVPSLSLSFFFEIYL